MATPMDSKLHKNQDETTQWLLQITQLLEQDNLKTALETPTSIFKLSDSVTIKNPEAYFPRRVALGPYHHFQGEELHKLELYKLKNAMKLREMFQLPEFNQIVDELKQLDIRIRSCFDRNLELGPESLARIMLIDGLFLIQLLAISYDEEEDILGRRCADLRLPFPFPLFGEQDLYYCLIGQNLMTQDEIVKDILKIENQIPIFVLKTLLPQDLSKNLHLLFFNFCVLVSPTRLPPYDVPEFMSYRGFSNLADILEQSHHLLHFLYLLILDESSPTDLPVGMAMPSFFLDFLNILASVLQIAFLQQLTEAVGLVQTLFGLLGRVKKSDQHNLMIPLIPSASKLVKVGVKLETNYENFHESILFKKDDSSSVIFELPSITINGFSEVVFRNLLAFEAAAKLNPPSLGYYLTLMSWLIITTKDVKLLEEAKIIKNNNQSDDKEEVVKLFNGVRSNLLDLKLYYRGGVDVDMAAQKIAKEINGYYESCWSVKAKRLINKYVFPVLKVLFILIVIMLIAFVVIRTFCGWFSCPKIFHLVLVKS